MPAPTRSIPLRERPSDYAFVAIAALFVLTTFLPDISRVIGTNLLALDRANPPAWPPLVVLDGLLWYGRACDHLFLQNPLFYRAIMFGDIFVTGPFYGAAVYAFWRGKNWIRIPAFLYASHVLSYAIILVPEELSGAYASPNPSLLFSFYAPYWLFGVALMIRLRRHRPFDPA